MTTIMGRILQDMNNRVGAGLFAELDDIDPCLVDEPAPVHSDTVGCALGGGNSEDTDDMPLCDCVEVCKRVTDEFHRHMAKMGIE